MNVWNIEDREQLRGLVCEMAAALRAFLECEGIPPTAQFREAHRLALAAIAKIDPQPGKV